MAVGVLIGISIFFPEYLDHNHVKRACLPKILPEVYKLLLSLSFCLPTVCTLILSITLKRNLCCAQRFWGGALLNSYHLVLLLGLLVPSNLVPLRRVDLCLSFLIDLVAV